MKNVTSTLYIVFDIVSACPVEDTANTNGTYTRHNQYICVSTI